MDYVNESDVASRLDEVLREVGLLTVEEPILLAPAPSLPDPPRRRDPVLEEIDIDRPTRSRTIWRGRPAPVVPPVTLSPPDLAPRSRALTGVVHRLLRGPRVADNE
jgi:hypothetical protein